MSGGSGPVHPSGPRVLVVGSGWRFTSGISYYTCRLVNSLAAAVPTGAILIRRLVPVLLYPGRGRVGVAVNDLTYDQGVAVFDGIDWFWGRSILQARRFLIRQAPDVLVLQWWTGAVLHSYLLLAALARRRGIKVVMEWHEVQDTGEARIPGVVRYVQAAMRGLLRNVDAHVVHSHYDLDLLERAFGLRRSTVTVVPHGPYDHVATPRENPDALRRSVADAPVDAAAEEPFTILYFGVIRPYKGVEDLVEAFERLPAQLARRLRLTIVGETWEGWTRPLDAIARSAYRDRITVVNRYVSDAEVKQHFAAADAVVLPYLRSSSSGPLHIAMSAGLPVVVTSVGGLLEAAEGYQGATFVPPGDPGALAGALQRLPQLRGQRFADPRSWQATVDSYVELFAALASTPISGSLSERSSA